jgi:iron complex outermembrane recepter protein
MTKYFGFELIAGTARRALLGGCAVAALTATPAFAQDAAADAAAAQTSGTGMEEIVVTAQRRTERLENVPMAVSALTANALEKANVVNVHELSRIAPGVQFNFAGVSTQPAVRGITSLTNGTGNENNVAIYVDGFYVSDNITINQDLANLQSIQVLKGPQGTLYGRNATGGAILIQTLDPTDELSGKFEGSYARFNEKRLMGYISAPLSDKVGFIVAGALRNGDGWIGKSDPTNNQRNIGKFNPQKQRSFRSKLKAELSDDLTATLAYNYGFTSDTSGNIFTPQAYVVTVPSDNRRAVNFGTASGNYKNIAAGKTNEATLKLEWDLGIGKLTSYTGYNKRTVRNDFDFDGTYSDLTFNQSFPDFKTFQQAADFVINRFDNLDLIVGGLYFNEKFHNDTFNYGASRVVTSQQIRNLKTEAWAIYADATYHVTDDLTIGVGGRYSNDDKSGDLQVLNGVGAVVVPLSPHQKSFKKFTPRATIRYTLAPRTNVYASYSKGFRSGSFNASGSTALAATTPIKPEDITAYEIGFKTVQSIFRFEAAAFYYDYKNLNVALTVPNPICAGQPICNPTTLVGNAPKAKVKGIDAQLTATPVEKLNITLGGAWLHARYGKFANAVGNGINAAGTANVSGQTQDWSGKQMSRAPDLSANLSVDYSVPVADGELRLSGNVKYSDSFVISNPSLFGPLAPAAIANKQRYRQSAYTVVDGEITWFSPDQKYWIGLFGKNLTNKSYRLSYNGATFGDYSTKAPPITYGVKAGYKF